MTNWQKTSIFLLRISLGWMFFYNGITKILNPQWTAEGYLKNAKTFTGFYQWLTAPDIIPVLNFLNEWGLTLLGIALILGIFIRLSSILGIFLMALYYFPILDFPKAGSNALIIDQHVIYALTLMLLASIRAGRIWGLEVWCARLPICSKFPKIRNWLG